MHTKIPNWERERGQPFLVNGARFLDDLADRMAQEAVGKENKRVSLPIIPFGALYPYVPSGASENASAR